MKKFISLFMSAALITAPMVSADIGTLPYEEDFEDVEVVTINNVANTQNEPTSEKLEAVIKKVKPLLDVPEEYEEFSWHFNAGSYYSLASWRLQWYGENGEVYVSCDNEGRITSYEHYTFDKKTFAQLPEISPEKLVPVAEEFIRKILPHTAGSEFKLSNTGFASVYNDTYSFHFTRYENGIIVPENTITVSVNYKTSEVESLRCSYVSDISFDNKDIVISEDAAKNTLSENQKMVLSYRLKTEYDDETGEVKSRKAYLVYTPEISYASVDPFTGEVYFERDTWSVNTSNKNMVTGGAGGAMFDSAAKEESADAEEGYRLTEKELEQLGVLDSLISKDDAIAIITGNEDLYIDPLATAVTANLSKDYGKPEPIITKNADGTETKEEQYIWNIYFEAPYDKDNKYSYSYMSATVDANDGTIISFSASTPNYLYYSENKISVPELKFTNEEALEISEAFIKKNQPEKSKTLRKSDSHSYSAIKYIESEDNSIPVYGNIAFTHVRTNEGVDFTYNSFNTAVDLVTGKITRYGYTWYDDVEFESPKEVITPKEASLSFYSYDGFGLNYEINSHYTYNKYLADSKSGTYIDYDALYETTVYSRLVYSAYAPGTTVIRAKDGVMIDYSGEEYKKSVPYSYSDISGHWAENTILRFSYINVGFEGDKFLPDSYITSEEFENFLSNARIYGYYEDMFELPEGNEITRADAVKYIISSLGYYKVASLENVFITDFADNTELLSQDVGFIAIARGLGFIEGDGNTFRPYDKLTRAEAFAIVEKIIDLKIMN